MRSVLDLTPRTRAAFAVAFVALQLALIATVSLRADHVFGFQMFNASSNLQITLFRRVHGKRGGLREVPVSNGIWTARDAHGEKHRFRWSDRVRDRWLTALGRPIHAKDGVDAQLFHLQHALDDVARHTPDDAETVALIARVVASDNGRPLPEVELVGLRP